MHRKIILITGCAGFIGYSICKQLLFNGFIDDLIIIGIDNLNDYYDVNLKKSRLNILQKFKNFIFYQLDLKNKEDILSLVNKHSDINFILHLAAQAGVRYSLINPFVYVDSNITGFLTILELAKDLNCLKHLVYASSSSVYGSNKKLPFSIKDVVDTPISLYAASKKSCELMAHCYSHIWGLPITGLRFFTVYGPWGRPDMSAFIFTESILNNKPISVFNHGDMKRNFTYIDDIVSGTINCLFKLRMKSKSLHNIYNLGNNRAEKLMDFIEELEKQLNIKAKLDFKPMQPGDVKETIADITESQQDFDFEPKTNIQEGLKNFVAWYKEYHHRICV